MQCSDVVRQPCQPCCRRTRIHIEAVQAGGIAFWTLSDCLFIQMSQLSADPHLLITPLICAVAECGGRLLQVLPESMLVLAEPCPSDLVAAVETGMQRLPFVNAWRQHEQARCNLGP